MQLAPDYTSAVWKYKIVDDISWVVIDAIIFLIIVVVASCMIRSLWGSAGLSAGDPAAVARQRAQVTKLLVFVSLLLALLLGMIVFLALRVPGNLSNRVTLTAENPPSLPTGPFASSLLACSFSLFVYSAFHFLFVRTAGFFGVLTACLQDLIILAAAFVGSFFRFVCFTRFSSILFQC